MASISDLETAVILGELFGLVREGRDEAPPLGSVAASFEFHEEHFRHAGCDAAALFLKQALCAWRAKRPETCRRKVLECLLDVSRRLEKAAQPDTRPMGRWAHEAAPTPPPPASPPPVEELCGDNLLDRLEERPEPEAVVIGWGGPRPSKWKH